MTTAHSVIKQPSVDHSHSVQSKSGHEIEVLSRTMSHSVPKQPSVDHSQSNSRHETEVLSMATSRSVMRQPSVDHPGPNQVSTSGVITSHSFMEELVQAGQKIETEIENETSIQLTNETRNKEKVTGTRTETSNPLTNET